MQLMTINTITGIITATRAFALGFLNNQIIHKMNQMNNKGKQIMNPIIPKRANITFQSNTKNAERNKINPMMLNRIPTVATVFFCSF